MRLISGFAYPVSVSVEITSSIMVSGTFKSKQYMLRVGQGQLGPIKGH